MLKGDSGLDVIDSIAAEDIRFQVQRVSLDPALASSKRSVAFLTYVVEETLRGAAEGLKERTIGVEVYGRSPTYDTNLDHVVRTAGLELRRRLAIYYGDPRHSAELRILLKPGSYAPRFTWPPKTDSHLPQQDREVESRESFPVTELDGTIPELARPERFVRFTQGPRRTTWGTAAVLVLLAVLGSFWLNRIRVAQRPDALKVFWAPLTDGSASILIAVGTAREGLPKTATSLDGNTLVIPGPAVPRYIPYADAQTMATVAGEMRGFGKTVRIRRSLDTTFSDLRQMPAVLIGAFDNPWSLRLMENMRYGMEVDEQAKEVYIRDARAPLSRRWQWKNKPLEMVPGKDGTPVLHDYALISRIHDARTGRAVMLIAGLEPYGTEVAGEFVTDPDQLASLAKVVSLSDSRNLQIVLETTVVDGSPGTPHVIAVSQEEATLRASSSSLP